VKTLLQVAKGIKQAQAQSKERKMTIIPPPYCIYPGNFKNPSRFQEKLFILHFLFDFIIISNLLIGYDM